MLKQGTALGEEASQEHEDEDEGPQQTAEMGLERLKVRTRSLSPLARALTLGLL